MKLEGQVALVTGAGRGIGRGIAIKLAAEGATVVINYHLSQSSADELCRDIRLTGRDALAIRADVSIEQDVMKMFEETSTRFGRLDILVNNAGVERFSPLADMPVAVWNEILDTNLKSVFLCCKHAIPRLKRTGKGRIINVSSDAGKTGYKYLSAYCASKFGVLGLTQSLAKELAQYNITVNAICPGATDTEMLYDYYHRMAEHGVEDPERSLMEAIPLRRIAKPEEVGDLVVFLATDESSYITGEAINFSGGMEMH